MRELLVGALLVTVAARLVSGVVALGGGLASLEPTSVRLAFLAAEEERMERGLGPLAPAWRTIRDLGLPAGRPIAVVVRKDDPLEVRLRALDLAMALHPVELVPFDVADVPSPEQLAEAARGAVGDVIAVFVGPGLAPAPGGPLERIGGRDPATVWRLRREGR